MQVGEKKTKICCHALIDHGEYVFCSQFWYRISFPFLLFFVQVTTDLLKMHLQSLSVTNTSIILELFSSIASHAHELNSETLLQKKLQKACSILGLTPPPMVHFENESHQNYLNFLQNLLANNPSLCKEINVEAELITACIKILQIYVSCTGSISAHQRLVDQPVPHWILPLGSAKKEELATRTSLVVSALRVLSGLENDSFKRYVSQIFPLLVDLVRSEHSSGEVQRVLSYLFQSCIGPIVME